LPGCAFLLLKPDDVPTYVEYGAADLGVCGRDVLVERRCDVYQPLDLEMGNAEWW
jgi:ATP phosphoribosyltransferase